MPIYEYACPKCRKIFSFLSKRIVVTLSPVCPKCGARKLSRQMSQFALTGGGSEAEASESDQGMPNMDDPKMARAMSELEREMPGLDENNPRHMAHILKKLKAVVGEKAMPKEFDVAIRRLEAGEDPEKIEQEMGPLFDSLMGEESGGGGGGDYSRDPGLYDL